MRGGFGLGVWYDIIVAMPKNAQLNKTTAVDYDANLKELLGEGKLNLKILERSHGLLKGRLKISSVAYQRKVRQEWEKRLKRQFR